MWIILSRSFVAVAIGAQSRKVTAPFSDIAIRSTEHFESSRSPTSHTTSRSVARRFALTQSPSICVAMVQPFGSRSRASVRNSWMHSPPPDTFRFYPAGCLFACDRLISSRPVPANCRTMAQTTHAALLGEPGAGEVDASRRNLVTAAEASPVPGGFLLLNAHSLWSSIAACPSSVRRDVIAISPNCRGGTRHNRGLSTSTLTAPQ